MKFFLTRFSFQILRIFLYYAPLTFLGSTLFVCISGCNGEASNRYQCMITSPSGTWLGSLNSSVLNQYIKYCSYRDVPYGEPPVGKHRFGVSVLRKPLPLGVIYNATQDRHQCPQGIMLTNDNVNITSEDCLYLNVYSPYYGEISHNSPLLPVIVHVHGGAYTLGSKRQIFASPDYFMPQKVIFVSVNYRMGAFGFLNLNISEAPGNQGLWDQKLALEWVRKNIRSFGGDPNCVTSMGESAGAIMVGQQVLSPKFRGLFHKVIMQSARGPLLPRTYGNESVAFALGVDYKGNIKDNYAILRYLQGLNMSRLVQGLTSYKTKVDSLANALGPTRDDAGPDALFPGSEKNLSAKAPNIPCLVGYDTTDGTVFFSKGSPNVTVNYTLSNLGKILKTYIDSVFGKDNRTLEKVIEKVKAYYFNPRDKDNRIDQTAKFLSFVYNGQFYDNVVRVSEASYASRNVWAYFFDYSAGYSDYKKFMVGDAYANQVHGAGHSEELSYLFFNPYFYPNGFQGTKRELKLIKKMTTLWSNFARTGSPNSNCDSIEVNWYPTTPFQDNYLWIQNSSEPVMVMKRKINQRNTGYFCDFRVAANDFELYASRTDFFKVQVSSHHITQAMFLIGSEMK